MTSAPFGEVPKHCEHNPLHTGGTDETRKHWKFSGGDFDDKGGFLSDTGLLVRMSLQASETLLPNIQIQGVLDLFLLPVCKQKANTVKGIYTAVYLSQPNFKLQPSQSF